MDSFEDFVRDPKHRKQFEKLLRMAAKRGDTDLVAERLGWGINPNCTTPKGRTPLIVNIRGSCPSAGTVRALLKAGADATLIDQTGLSALDYARRKLAKLHAQPTKLPRKSPSLDENNQLKLTRGEQAMLDRLRQKGGREGRERVRLYWQERLRAARRVFNDPAQVEAIVNLLETKP